MPTSDVIFLARRPNGGFFEIVTLSQDDFDSLPELDLMAFPIYHCNGRFWPPPSPDVLIGKWVGNAYC